MTVRLLLAALLAFPVFGAFRVSLAKGFTETPLEAVFKLPPTEAGSTVELRFRARAGVSAEKLTVFKLDGADFVTTQAAIVPVSLAPGAYIEIWVEFRPSVAGSSSATLQVNDQRYTIVAEVAPAAYVRLEDGTPLRVSEPVNFGAVELGARASRAFVIENPAAAPATIDRLEIAGTAFRSQLPAAPFKLAPGASTAFEVTFEPQSEGRHGATLYVNGREYAFEGSATMPAIPRPRIAADPAALRSGRQARIAVKLEAPAKWPVNGVLRMKFAGPADPAVRLLSGDGQALAFRIAAGDDTARFGAFEAAEFQTGATSGRVTFAVELGPWREEAAFDLPPLPVEFDTVSAVAVPAGLAIEIRGFDNTRTASSLAFTFLDRKGRVIGKGPIRLDVSQDFRRYFDGTALGGVFSLQANFPVRGSVADIGSVEVEMVNAQGPAKKSVTMSQ